MTERVFASSDPLWQTPPDAPGRPFGGASLTLDPARPEPPRQAAVVVQEAHMAPPPLGRPRGLESDRRHREFLRVLSATGSFDEAIRLSGMSTKRLPKILDEKTFRALCVAVMNDTALTAVPFEAQAA